MKNRHRFWALALLLALILLGGCRPFQSVSYDSAMTLARCWAGLDQNEVTVDGHRMVYYTGGKPDAETVLMLHGFSGDKSNWLLWIPHLAEQYHIVAVDLPAHGESDYDPKADYSIIRQSERLALFVDAAGLKRFHLVGNSMGGAISIYYTCGHPDRVITLGLIATGGVESPEPSEFLKRLEQGENLLVVNNMAEFRRMLDLAMEDKPFMPWPITAEAAARHIGRREIHAKVFSDLIGSREHLDMLPFLPRISTPTLIVWGREDRILHVSSVQVLEEHLPNAQSVILEGVGHVPMMERPKETADHFLKFYREQRKIDDAAL